MGQISRLRAVIFDLDGTLVDSVPMALAVINAMLAERGSDRRLNPEQARPFASSGGLALMRGLLAEDCGDPEIELRDFRERYNSHETPPESIYDGVVPMLDCLNEAGLRLAVCSNKPQPLCEKVLGDLQLADRFEVVMGSRPGVPEKPNPEMLDLLLTELDVSPSSCIFVGDSEVDVQFAASRAMPVMFVTHGYGNADESIARENRFDHLSTLGQAILMRASETDAVLAPAKAGC